MTRTKITTKVFPGPQNIGLFATERAFHLVLPMEASTQPVEHRLLVVDQQDARERVTEWHCLFLPGCDLRQLRSRRPPAAQSVSARRTSFRRPARWRT